MKRHKVEAAKGVTTDVFNCSSFAAHDIANMIRKEIKNKALKLAYKAGQMTLDQVNASRLLLDLPPLSSFHVRRPKLSILSKTRAEAFEAVPSFRMKESEGMGMSAEEMVIVQRKQAELLAAMYDSDIPDPFEALRADRVYRAGSGFYERD